MTTSQKNSSEQPAPTPAWVNKMMMWLLRSPLHGTVSKKMMLMTVTGRKSGKKYTFPVSYIREGGGMICMSNRVGRTWWKNLRGGADVTLRLRGKAVAGYATVVEDDLEAITKGIETMYRHVKRPLPENITQFAQQHVIINIKI